MHILAPTMYQLWVQIFDRYEPIMTDVYDANGHVVGQVVAEGAAGVNWQFVLMVVAFLILLYGSLRIIEAVLRNA